MSDELSVSVSVSVLLDDDGFLRRECPRCERQFKWFIQDEAFGDVDRADQYFCPLCGEPSGLDSWSTPDQIDHAQRSAGPEIDRVVQDSVSDLFKGIKSLTYRPNRNLSLGIPIPDPLVEPNDMVIVEPPCHPLEPLKVPEEHTHRAFCLICGSPFAA